MPPTATSTARNLTRRSVLFAAMATTFWACTADPAPAPLPTSPPTPEPDDLLRGEVAAAERSLLALYAAVSSRHPTLAQPLAPFATRHRRHLRAVEESGPVPTPTSTPPATPPADATAAPPSPAATASPADATAAPPSPVATASPPSLPVPADPVEALAFLQAAERAAAEARIADCVRSADAALAELLASVAACEAAHDALLAVAL